MFAGSVLAMAAPPAGGGSFVQGIIPFVIIAAIFYFVILLPTRRKQQKVQEFLQKLKEGDKVITTGGIYGQITKLNEHSIVLQVADKIRIEVARASIGGYQGQPPVVDSAQ
jgi:preprotein translocase subunit YajC